MERYKYTSIRAHNQGEANRSQIYTFVCQFIKIHGFAPSVKEIGASVGLSIGAVSKHLRILIDNGLLETDYSRPAARNIQIPKGAM